MEGLRTFLITDSAEATIDLGRQLGSLLMAGDLVALNGELGSGKTTFSKGLCLGCEVPDALRVKSPTFTMMSEYQGRIPVYHFDFYRISTLQELEAIGWDELTGGDAAIVVEWASRIPDAWPNDYLEISFSDLDVDTRKIEWIAHGKRYENLVRQLAGN